MSNKINQLFNIPYPIIQAGMIWCSGWELASSVSNAGGLGLIGGGSMYPEIFRELIHKCQRAATKPFGVNIPLLYPDIDKHMEIVFEERVKIVFTSAGNPQTWTSRLKERGIIVVHVVSNVKFAKKAMVSGVDAIVAEGFEAGGHNGREETTTMCLIPIMKQEVNLPIIAAGGIGNGASMFAAMALGADGVQIGTRFVASEESSCHINFKNKIINSLDGDTILTLKQLTPVRLMKNKFYEKVKEAELEGASIDKFKQILGSARAKKGMFEGDLDEGELEIGQISALIKDIKPASSIILDIIREFLETKERLTKESFL